MQRNDMKRIIIIIALISIATTPASGNGHLRLLVVGDSLTAGLYASSEQNGFRYILANRLHADLASCSGRNIQNLETCWNAYQGWNPDVVVIEIGLNDVSNYGGTALSFEEWQVSYTVLVADIQATGARVVMTTMFNGWLGESTNDYELYNDFIRETAVSQNVILADVWQATANCGKCVSKPDDLSAFPPFHGDNFHPSDYGHGIIAETVYNALQGTIYFPVVNK